MERVYQSIIQQHLSQYDQMVLMPGPRQVGKTTIARALCQQYTNQLYLNWDLQADREIILEGQKALIDRLNLDQLGVSKPLVAFDEIHKLSNWKNYLKGYFDYTKGQTDTLVTGSAQLDIYQKGGDSLMGRYFLYHIHPLSVGELLNRPYQSQTIFKPQRLADDQWQALFQFGGFPEPFAHQQMSFLKRWQNLRLQQLFKEDIRNLTQVTHIDQMEILAKTLTYQASERFNTSKLAKKIQVSDVTIKHWIQILESLYFCFLIRPWSNNIARSLVKEPKLFLWDWSIIEDAGARYENMIACHLLKAVHYWNDTGLGDYQLYYVRDKNKNEVDFLITYNNQPWLLAETKMSAKQPISPQLRSFQQQVQAQHVLQIAYDMPYVEADCFNLDKPTIVPAQTFLSQLV